MARECPKCGNKVPRQIWIDGKNHNCQRRRYCFTCSPFGQHNTSRLERVGFNREGIRVKTCPVCGREHTQKGDKCPSCYYTTRRDRVSNKVHSIVGEECWICKYNRTRKNLCFHHVDEDKKLFGLSSREMTGLSWKRVWPEIKKCVLICANCHGEVHAGIIPTGKIDKLWESRWQKILSKLLFFS